MRRRTLVQTLIAWWSLRGSRLLAQTPVFPGKHEATLNELAATVLPESLGRTATDAIAADFVRWVREYRAGAEMQTGYGTTRVRFKGASPAPKYLEQLETLSSAVLGQSGLAKRRAALAEVLQTAGIRDLPMSPDGGHVATDLITFYFQSSAANDYVYRASIGKDQCRTLKNSGAVPPPWKGSANGAF